MPWNWCGCCKPEREDVRELDYQHLGLKEVPVNVFVHERTLEELNLEANRVTELPRALFHCHGLRVVNLSDNDISVVPPAIASLINLQHLNLSKNSLCDIPDNIKCCKQLVHINLSVNPLEKLPDGFTQLIALEEVYLNDTFLEFLPANFGRLSKLRILDVRENNLNTLPKSIARLCNLQVLDIGKNEFSDLPEVIGNLPVLTELWADYNRIRCIPQFIGNLTKLTHLDLSNNNVNWIAGNIEKCVHLYFLALTGNELQTIPDEIGSLKELNLLKIDDNDIACLPSTLGKLINLNELVASQNILEALPTNIGLLRKLEVLNMDDNRLSSLPSEIGSCSNLRILSVRNNCLESFPAELGHLASIRVINVADNFLMNLPVSILNLHQLTALWLSTNQTTPLTTLQQEIDPATGQMICVNFMFPQVDQERNLDELTGGRETERPAGPRIRFADNTELLHPSRLTRAPTPYPKELRTMAKHARVLATQPRSPSVVDENMPLLDEMQVGTATPVKIKVATVTKPSTTSLVDAVPKNMTVNQVYSDDCWSMNKDSASVARTSNLPDVLDLSCFGSLYDESVALTAEDNESNGGEDQAMNGHFDQSTDSVFTKESQTENLSSKVALCEDGDSTKDNLQVKENGQSIDNMSHNEFESAAEESVKENSSTDLSTTVTYTSILKDLSAAKQPPPYHIAAAYSKQAAYFNNPSAYTVDPSSSYTEQQGSDNQSPSDLSLNMEEHKHSSQLLTNSCAQLKPVPLPDQSISSIEDMASLKQTANLDEVALNNSEDEIAFDNNALNSSWQQTNAKEPFLKALTEESGPKPTQTSVPEKPLSKIPFLKSKLPEHICKPSQQSRILQPGFYVSRQRTPDAFVSKIPTVKTSLPSPDSPTSVSPWVFGQHKNPTVFPVTIKKNPGLGFTIAGGATLPGFTDKQEGGIFITKVNPNGPAANSLMPGDKILEVDGIDFSKLGHDQAVAILKQCKQLVNMMVSRQK